MVGPLPLYQLAVPAEQRRRFDEEGDPAAKQRKEGNLTKDEFERINRKADKVLKAKTNRIRRSLPGEGFL